MSERSGVPVIPLPKGVVWRSRKEGEDGKSFAEFAVKTPRFPDYITTTELRYSSHAVQAETASFWFYANLEPYDTSRVALGVGSRPHGDVVLYPDAMSSDQALSAALGAGLDRGVHAELAASLPGVWMWRRDPPSLDTLPAILARLDALAEEVRQLAAAHGQMGHNSGAWYPEEAQREALEIIAETKLAVRAYAEDRTPISEETLSRFTRVVDALGNCFMRVWSVVAKPVLIGAETEAGKLLVHLAVGWLNGQSIAESLKNWR